MDGERVFALRLGGAKPPNQNAFVRDKKDEAGTWSVGSGGHNGHYGAIRVSPVVEGVVVTARARQKTLFFRSDGTLTDYKHFAAEDAKEDVAARNKALQEAEERRQAEAEAARKAREKEADDRRKVQAEKDRRLNEPTEAEARADMVKAVNALFDRDPEQPPHFVIANFTHEQLAEAETEEEVKRVKGKIGAWNTPAKRDAVVRAAENGTMLGVVPSTLPGAPVVFDKDTGNVDLSIYPAEPLAVLRTRRKGGRHHFVRRDGAPGWKPKAPKGETTTIGDSGVPVQGDWLQKWGPDFAAGETRWDNGFVYIHARAQFAAIDWDARPLEISDKKLLELRQRAEAERKVQAEAEHAANEFEKARGSFVRGGAAPSILSPVLHRKHRKPIASGGWAGDCPRCGGTTRLKITPHPDNKPDDPDIVDRSVIKCWHPDCDPAELAAVVDRLGEEHFGLDWDPFSRKEPVERLRPAALLGREFGRRIAPSTWWSAPEAGAPNDWWWWRGTHWEAIRRAEDNRAGGRELNTFLEEHRTGVGRTLLSLAEPAVASLKNSITGKLRVNEHSTFVETAFGRAPTKKDIEGGNETPGGVHDPGLFARSERMLRPFREGMALLGDDKWNATTEMLGFGHALRNAAFREGRPENKPGALSVANGMVNISTGELVPHHPDTTTATTTVAGDAEFVVNATPEQLQEGAKTLLEAYPQFDKNADGRKAFAFLIEWVGWSLLQAGKGNRRVLLIIGSANSGKSTLGSDIVEAFGGMAQDPGMLDPGVRNNARCSLLEQRPLFASWAELKRIMAAQTPVFLWLTGGDAGRVRRNYGDDIEGKVSTAFVAWATEPPTFEQDTREGLGRRIAGLRIPHHVWSDARTEVMVPQAKRWGALITLGINAARIIMELDAYQPPAGDLRAVMRKSDPTFAWARTLPDPKSIFGKTVGEVAELVTQAEVKHASEHEGADVSADDVKVSAKAAGTGLVSAGFITKRRNVVLRDKETGKPLLNKNGTKKRAKRKVVVAHDGSEQPRAYALAQIEEWFRDEDEEEEPTAEELDEMLGERREEGEKNTKNPKRAAAAKKHTTRAQTPRQHTPENGQQAPADTVDHSRCRRCRLRGSFCNRCPKSEPEKSWCFARQSKNVCIHTQAGNWCDAAWE